MDVMLQRHCAKYIYVVPEGLRELMSDISREVLRSQPEDIYTFIADYLDALMITRENARVAARFVETLTELGATVVELLIEAGMEMEDANIVAEITQETFKMHFTEKPAAKEEDGAEDEEDEANIINQIMNRAGLYPEEIEKAAIVIQKAYRNFKYRQQREASLLDGMVDWRIAARSTMRLYRKAGVTNEEANRAATLIKAAYKGYYTRRLMKRLLEESKKPSEESSISFEEEEEEEEQSEYIFSWENNQEFDYGEDEDSQYVFAQKEEMLGENEESTVKLEMENSQVIATSIVESLLKHAVLDTVSSPGSVLTVDEMPEIETETVSLEIKPGNTEPDNTETSESPLITETETGQPDNIETSESPLITETETVQPDNTETSESPLITETETVQPDNTETSESPLITETETVQPDVTEISESPLTETETTQPNNTEISEDPLITETNQSEEI